MGLTYNVLVSIPAMVILSSLFSEEVYFCVSQHLRSTYISVLKAC